MGVSSTMAVAPVLIQLNRIAPGCSKNARELAARSITAQAEEGEPVVGEKH